MKIHPFLPPAGWPAITTIDAHTAGEPFRVVTGGLPELPGDTILERRRSMRERFDHLRTLLMWEPRGHADMYGCIVTPPVSEGADFGVLFTHNEGYSSMCGHGTIFIAPAREAGHHSRNVCIFADGEVDRSPTGTGVSARLAIHHARGEIGLDQAITIESIVGTCFDGRVAATAEFGPHAAVIPEVAGAAHITGCHTFLIDPDDPLRKGFVLR